MSLYKIHLICLTRLITPIYSVPTRLKVWALSVVPVLTDAKQPSKSCQHEKPDLFEAITKLEAIVQSKHPYHSSACSRSPLMTLEFSVIVARFGICQSDCF